MNENDPKLREALRGLAADGPREAPAHVEERLLGELRRRSRARQRNLRVSVLTGAIAAGFALLLWMRPAHEAPARTVVPSEVQATANEVEQGSLSDDDETAMNFEQLPDTDELPPMESTTIVRLQLPMSSLRLMGLPVSEERAGEAIQADVLLGQDGLARGVRFVE
jgi:hypothetical protein